MDLSGSDRSAHLLCQQLICLGSPGEGVIGVDGLAVAEEVKRHFPGQVYATVIPRNVRLSEAPSHGKPISAYDRSSRGAEAYKLLAEEMCGAG